MTRSAAELKTAITEGVLAFPATAFTADGALDLGATEAHVAELARHRPCALVPAGGAGELFSLAPQEHAAVVRTTVANACGLPVIAGVGQGLAIAREMARNAEKAGADAVLVLPPYLINAEQAGLEAFLRAICEAVGIAVIGYSRDNGVLAPQTALRLAEACPNFLGVKDGTGDFEALTELRLRAGDRLLVINGVPTAEILAAQCFAIGVRSYSSAVFAFLPEVASAFYRAARDGSIALRDRLLAEFYLPLIALRRRKRGHAVALVKAGLRAAGRPAGPVRPPLVDFDEDEQRELAALIGRARSIVG